MLNHLTELPVHGSTLLSESISAAKMERSSAAFSETSVPQFLVSKVQVVNDICSNISD